MEWDRLTLLLGDNINVLKEKCVLILGVGGVGGYVVEALARLAIGKLILVDFDTVDISNINRQIIALHSTLGEYKVDVFEKRIHDINPHCEVVVLKEKIDVQNIELLFQTPIDFFVDACDTVSVKKEVIRSCIRRKIPFISCMGTGNKLDASKLCICDIRSTSYDPLARVIRKMVLEEKIKENVMVVSSCEVPIKTDSKRIGSISFVPAVAGLLCANYVFSQLIGDV